MNKKPFGYQKVLEISGKLGLPIKKILDMLWFLKSAELDNNELVRKVGLSKNGINQAKELLSDFLAPSSSKTALTEIGRTSVRSMFSETYKPEESMWSFLDKDSKYVEVVDLLDRNKPSRIIPKENLDQYTATPDTEARRALLMNFFGDIKRKKVLFLGVDFTSLAASYIGEASQIQVLDIDQDVLNSLEKVAESEKISIKTTSYDARIDLPISFRGIFDVVFIDPPYTISGAQLFISRAIEALNKRNLSARLYFSYGGSDKSKERFLPVYEALFKSGLMIRWVFDKFNRYETGAESIGSTSSLFICDICSKSRSLIKGSFKSDIYTR